MKFNSALWFRVFLLLFCFSSISVLTGAQEDIRSALKMRGFAIENMVNSSGNEALQKFIDEHFSPEFKAAFSSEDHLEQLRLIRSQCGNAGGIMWERLDENGIRITFQSEEGRSALLKFKVQTSPPYQIIGMALEEGAKTEIMLKIAELGKKLGAITLGVLVKPSIEEKPTSNISTQLLQTCDTIAVIDTSKLNELRSEMPSDKISEVADRVLAKMIKNIAETISSPSLKNLDFSEFKAIIEHGGNAMIGIGESEAPNRAIEAAIQSLENPLFTTDHTNATKAMVHITGDNHMTLEEAKRVNNAVTDLLKNDIQVIWGANADPELDRKIRVTLVMTGMNSSRTLRSFNLIAPDLFNLEPNSEPEKILPVDLGLYQLENFET